jgi:hypothetical protein
LATTVARNHGKNCVLRYGALLWEAIAWNLAEHPVSKVGEAQNAMTPCSFHSMSYEYKKYFHS